jgi:hypothetical protein
MNLLIWHFLPLIKGRKLLFTHLYTTLSYLKDNVGLACVKHLDSVQSEPSSNSIIINTTLQPLICIYIVYI